MQKLPLTSWAQRDRTLQETFTFTAKRESLLVIQIHERQKFFFSRNEELYVSEEVKENVLDSHQRENHADQKMHLRKSICVSRPLSMKQAAKIMHICSVVIYPLEKKFTEN